MAHATPELIEALRITAARLRSGARYQWGHLGQCNCGHLAQTLTRRSDQEIHRAALRLGGEWRDRMRDHCPTSGQPIDEMIRVMLSHGLTAGELADLEYLSDDRVLKEVARTCGRRDLTRNVRDDVIVYLEAWARLLEQRLPTDELQVTELAEAGR